MSGSTDSGTDSDTLVAMTPWLHFVGGDNLFFKTLTPSSHGAIAGACIVLALLAILDRYLSALRGVAEAKWVSSARALTTRLQHASESNLGVDAASSTDKDESKGTLDGAPSERDLLVRDTRATRLSPPFVASHDIPRGIAFALQAVLGYALMLAVMTFQAAYIIAIVVGLGIGEVSFGRLGSARGHIVH